jgi:hypothetical protein
LNGPLEKEFPGLLQNTLALQQLDECPEMMKNMAISGL